MADPDEAREWGVRARRAALDRYSLERFLTNWDDLLGELTGAPPEFGQREEVAA